MSITRRAVVGSVALAAVVGVAFVVVRVEIEEMRRAGRLAAHSEQVLTAANHLERVVVDLETGLRGYALTGTEPLLAPLNAAQRAFPGDAEALVRLADATPAGPAGQTGRARQIEQAGTAYIRDYIDPTLEAVRRDVAALPAVSGLLQPSPQTAAAFEQGKRRIDDLRGQFDRFTAVERDLAAARQRGSASAARRAILAATAGVGGSTALVALFAVYLIRVIVAPVRRAAAMAGRLAAGDLSVRMPESGPGEIGGLEQAFNTMAQSLRENRAELIASRARVVAAADEARRRIERDLHDGIQQRLVALALDLRALEETAPPDAVDHWKGLAAIEQSLTEAIEGLREVSRGIHPAILARGGLATALKALARRSAVPVQVEVGDVNKRVPEHVGVAVYYVVSEALTNAAKHASASAVHIGVHVGGGRVCLSIRDNGVGGADPGRGSGLVGLRDRVEAIGGTIDVQSPPGHGTTYRVEIPIAGD